MNECHGLPNKQIRFFSLSPLSLSHSRGMTVVLLPWRLQINSIMQYLFFLFPRRGFSRLCRHRDLGSSHLGSDWLRPDTALPLRFWCAVRRGGGGGGGGVSPDRRAHASRLNTLRGRGDEQRHRIAEQSLRQEDGSRCYFSGCK